MTANGRVGFVQVQTSTPAAAGRVGFIQVTNANVPAIGRVGFIQVTAGSVSLPPTNIVVRLSGAWVPVVAIKRREGGAWA